MDKKFTQNPNAPPELKHGDFVIRRGLGADFRLLYTHPTMDADDVDIYIPPCKQALLIASCKGFGLVLTTNCHIGWCPLSTLMKIA